MKPVSMLLALGIWFCSCWFARADLLNAIAAIVDDSVITYLEVSALNEETGQQLARDYRGKTAELERKLNEMQRENLGELVKRQLILHEFKSAGYNLPETVLDDIVNERIKDRYGDRATLTKTLEARGMTYEKFRQQIREQFIVAQLRLKNISQEIIISPHKMEAYYLAHREDYKLEDQVRYRMIALNKSSEPNLPQARKLAEEILAKLNEGASFAEMASIYSQDSSHSQAGDRGWVQKSELRKELAEAAFSLKPGEHSGLIDTPEVIYLVLVEDARPTHYKPLSEVRQQIEADLLANERTRLEKQWIGRLRKKTFVNEFF
jgi:peptidyl-prolyl cis-trans isomerase SurA